MAHEFLLDGRPAYEFTGLGNNPVIVYVRYQDKAGNWKHGRFLKFDSQELHKLSF